MSSQKIKLVIEKNKIKKSLEVFKILTKRGYSIIKDSFDDDIIDDIKKDLTVKPYVNEDYGPPAVAYPIFLESNKKLYLPKHYAFKKLGEPHSIKTSSGIDISLTF